MPTTLKIATAKTTTSNKQHASAVIYCSKLFGQLAVAAAGAAGGTTMLQGDQILFGNSHKVRNKYVQTYIHRLLSEMGTNLWRSLFDWKTKNLCTLLHLLRFPTKHT